MVHFAEGHSFVFTCLQQKVTKPVSCPQAVVKVRGNAGERRSWGPKNCWRAFPGPTQPLTVRAGRERPLQLTGGPQFFQNSWAPDLYFNHCPQGESAGVRRQTASWKLDEFYLAPCKLALTTTYLQYSVRG